MPRISSCSAPFARGSASLAIALALFLVPTISKATTSFLFESTTPDTLVDVRFTADLTISGNTLTVVLTNDSLNHTDGPSWSKNPNDTLSSFYFDIFNGSTRPTLTYTGAAGDVCLFMNAAIDDCTVTRDETPPGSTETDLRAFAANDDGWQLKQNLTLVVGTQALKFGIGTVGNHSLSPNNFNGNVVGGRDYVIYAGTTGTATEGGAPSLNGEYFVHNTATFTFTGVAGYTEAHIGTGVLFGLGTQPDSTGFVPEPSTALLLGLGLVGLAIRHRR